MREEVTCRAGHLKSPSLEYDLCPVFLLAHTFPVHCGCVAVYPALMHVVCIMDFPYK
jgi:hypothetical protein